MDLSFTKKIRLSAFINAQLRPILAVILFFLFSSTASAQQFTAKSLDDYGNVTVMEVTGNYDADNSDGTVNAVPRQVIAKEFFKTHKDEYDFLVIFSNFDFAMPQKEKGALGFYAGVKNDTQGLGLDIVDNTSLYGSNGKLQGTIDMGNIAGKATNPLDPKFEETLGILSHEMMHRWASYVKFKDANGNISTALLGRDSSHWSFLLDSGGSLMYGNTWQNNGNGTFTSTTPQSQMKFYSPLELYLMGMIDKSKVPPMLLIANPDVDTTQLPESGITINGTAEYVTIDQIIAANGSRVPDSSTSQKNFKSAFIFVTRPNTFTGNEIYGIENIRNGAVTRFSILTDGQGLMQVASTTKDNIPSNPGPLPPSTTPRTLPPNINEGVTWLVNNQKTDGSWIDVGQTMGRDTAAATLTLKDFTSGQPNYQSGLLWLGSAGTGAMDFSARRIAALIGSNQDATTFVQDLVSRQNSDGGWGSEKTYASNPLDTALALKALSVAGYNNQNVLSPAIQYIKSTQQPDGGWTGNHNSTIQSTATVLSVFNSYQQTTPSYQLTDSIAKATAWLVSKQNVDGGFGNSPSTIYSSASAIQALRELNVSTDITNRGLTYLLGQQSADGSWNASVYQTALAVSAVYKATVDPDLSIKPENITIIPATIKSIPTNIVINADIWNLGRTSAQATVALYDGAVSDQNKIGEQTLVFAGQAATTVTFAAQVKDASQHSFTLVADPGNLIKESSKLNNTAIKVLSPEGTYDFEVLSSDITLSANTVGMQQDVTITSRIANKGTMNAYNVQVKYYIDDPVTPFEIATQTIDIPSGATVTNTTTWRANKAGTNMPLTVMVDQFNNFNELSETNNKASTTITVNPDMRPNVTISYKDIVITPSPANERGTATISALVKNEGATAANNINVNFYRGIPGQQDTLLLGTQTIPSLASGQTSSISVTWQNIQESGEKVIYIKADPDNQIDEIRKDDNDAFTTLNILSLPDFTLAPNSIMFSPAAPKDGDPVAITVVVQNRGEQPAANVPVRVSEAGTTLADMTIPSLAGNSTGTVSLTYNTTGKKGPHTITVTIDADNVIIEQNKNNNTAANTFGVQDSNLWVTEPYFSPNGDGVKDTTQFFFSFTTKVSVTVAVVNSKGETVRLFNGPELQNITAGNVIWDGLNDKGVVVPDGEYKMQVMGTEDSVLALLPVVVDNNRSPFAEAIGTEYLHAKIVGCGYDSIVWMPTEENLLGIDLKKVTLLTPSGEKIANVAPAISAYEAYRDSYPSPDGSKLATIVDLGLLSYYDEYYLIITDVNGNLISSISQPFEFIPAEIFWSPDSKYFSVAAGVADDDNSDRMTVYSDAGVARFTGKNNSDPWSLDGSKFASGDALGGVYVTTVENMNTQKVTDVGAFVVDVQWLGDHKLIINASRNEFRNQWGQISRINFVQYIYDTVTGVLTNLDSTQFWYPAFSEDKKQFVYESKDNKTLVLVNSDGNVRNLYQLAADSYYYDIYIPGVGVFSNDGKKIAFAVSRSIYPANGPGCSASSAEVIDIVAIDIESGTSHISPAEKLICNGRYVVPEGKVMIGGWIDEANILASSSYGVFIINAITGERTYPVPSPALSDPIAPEWDPYEYSTIPRLSTLNNHIAWIINTGQHKVVPGCGDWGLEVATSLLNLTADFSFVKSGGQVNINGLATDKNFGGYKLEYATATAPDAWNAIGSASNSPVIFKTLATWIPPAPDTYSVRLTTWDKAGNALTALKKLTWGSNATITSLSPQPAYISPNADQVNDFTSIQYSVLEPMHLNFNVYNSQGALINNFPVDNPVIGPAAVLWDGRDSTNNVVPDGEYTVAVDDYKTTVLVDNTPPKTNLALGGLVHESWFLNPLGNRVKVNLPTDYVDFQGYAVDANIQEWRIEKLRGQDWLNVITGTYNTRSNETSPETPLNVMLGSEKELDDATTAPYRITVKDLAGNKTSMVAATPPREDLVIYSVVNQNREEFTTKDYSAAQGNKASNIVIKLGKEDVFQANNADPAAITLGFASTIQKGISAATLQFATNGTSNWVSAGVLTNPSVRKNSFSFNLKPIIQNLLNSEQVFLRVLLTDVDGKQYDSNHLVLFMTGVSCKTLGGLSVDAAVPETACGAQRNNSVTISASASGFSQCQFPDGTSTILRFTYDSIVLSLRHPDGPRHEIKKIVYNTPSATADISHEIETSRLPEGLYFIDAETTRTVHRTSEKLWIDRTAASIQINYPGNGQTVCAVNQTDKSGTWLGIPVEVAINDNFQFDRGEYVLSYGYGKNPSTWITAEIGEKPTPLSNLHTFNGRLLWWKVTNIDAPEGVRLKLILRDNGNNLSCAEEYIAFDKHAGLTTFEIPEKLFSPNGAGKVDEAIVQFGLSESALVGAKVYDTVAGATLGRNLKKTLIADTQYLAGNNVFSWNGRDANSAIVPDGIYGIEISVKDSCGNVTQQWRPVEVDTTAPVADIAYPKQGDQVGSIVEIKGTAYDIHFKNYTLEVGQGDRPSAWNAIVSSDKPVLQNVLGRWNVSNLTGRWTLRLIATDAAGNKKEKTSSLDLNANSTLIKNLNVLPIFSPNGDGKLDTATVSYELTDACNVMIEFLDVNSVVRRSYSTKVPSPGVYTYVWDGKDSMGVVAADGAFSVRLSAVLSSNTSMMQTEAVTVVLDNTAPVVDIKQPLNNSYTSAADIVVSGTINDANLSGYSINNGATLVDQANQPRENYTFGTLSNLAEGSYTLAVKATDLGQNETNKTIAFTVDRTPPAVKLDTPKNNEYYGTIVSAATGTNQQSATINITGSIVEKNLDVFNLRYGLGDAPTQWTDLATGTTVTSYTSPFAWKVGRNDGIADGVYTLSLYAKDKAGLIGETKIKVIIDNTVPTAAITSLHDGDYVKQAVDIKGTAFDQNIDKYIIEISEGQCASAFKWATIKTGTVSVQDNVLATWQALPPDGDYCLKLTVSDKLGSASEAKVNVKVDTHPPAAPVLSGKVDTKVNAQLDWTRNTETDIAGYNLYRNGEKINTAPLTDIKYLDQNLVEGVYTYTVKAQDLAGWESVASNQVKLKIDLTGPDARIRVPQDGARVSGLNDIKGTAYSADDFKQYRVYIGQGAAPSTWILLRTSPVPISYGTLAPWDTLGLAEGQVYSIKLEAEDISGNITAQQISVTIDNTPPAAPFLISASGVVNDVTITWRVNTEADLAGYLLYRNDQLANVVGVAGQNLGPYLIEETTYLDKALPDGTFKYYVVAMDKAGNMSYPSSIREMTIDTHPPHAKIVHPANIAKIGGKIIVTAESPDLDIASVQFQYQSIQSSPTTTTDWLNMGGPIPSTPMATYWDPATLNLAYGAYRLRAIATDKGNKIDPAPGFITITYADLTPPAVPQGLTALTNAGTVTLTWGANTENDLAGYNIYRTFGTARTKINSSLIAVTPQPAYQDSGLADGSYAYEVTAVDTHQNESKPSNTANATIYTPVITQPYTPVGESSLTLQGSKAAANATVSLFSSTTGTSLVSLGTTTADGTGQFTAPVVLNPGENRLTSRATDSLGNVSKNSEMMMVVYNEPPASPTGLTTSVTDYNVHLSWNANSETDIAGYNLYRNSGKINLPVAITSGTATASSSYYYPPLAAFDKNSSSYWQSGSNYNLSTPIWWQVEFPSSELLSRVEIHWWSESLSGKDFEIQAWSGYAWITLKTITGNTAKDTIFDFTPSYRTSKIRISITGTNDSSSNKYVAISEVQILKDALVTGQEYADPNLRDGKYDYTLAAVDYYGFESLPSSRVSAEVGDIIPPSAPLNLQAAVVGSDILLTWSANTEQDFAGYEIYRLLPEGWTKINPSLLSAVTFSELNRVNGTYTYRITAKDAVGNESLPSNETQATVFVVLPQPPVIRSVSQAPGGGALTVTWEHAGGTVAGYSVYRALTAGGPYTRVMNSLLADTFYVDTGLSNGTSYFYVVVALDLSGNESAYSNEMVGIPVDSVLPSKPVLLNPTTAGNPITIYTNRTDIAGLTEIGSQVALVRNGISVSTVIAEKKDIIKKIGIGSLVAPTPSPDGKTLAYIANNSLLLKDLATGQTTTTTAIVNLSTKPVWSLDGSRIAYAFSSNGYQRIGVYDMASGAGTALTNDTTAQEYSPSWSADAKKIIYVSTQGGGSNLWLKDVVTDSAMQITTGIWLSNPKLSPNGLKVAYFSYANSSWNIYVYDLSSGATTTAVADKNLNMSYLDWSLDGEKIAFVSSRTGNSEVFVYDTTDGTLVQLTHSADSEADPHWSPDGNSICYVKANNSLWVAAYPSGESRPVVQTGYFNYLTWLKSGVITYLYGNDLYFVTLDAGYFEFKGVALNQGENTFYAVAKDRSGNRSEASDPITVIYDISKTLELALSIDDMSLYPPYPLVGEKPTVNAVVRNTSSLNISNVDVSMYIWNSLGELEQLKSETIPSIAAGSSAVVSTSWNSAGKLGDNRLIVVVDPDDKIAEFDETNNMAIKDFYVADRVGVSMSTNLDALQYTSTQNANITVTTRNTGPVTNAVLLVQIEDANGYPVFAFDSRSMSLAYATEIPQSFVWNSGSTFAGSYKIHSTLKDASGNLLAENTVAFSILSDAAVDLTVVTDKIAYGPGENVVTNLNIRNTGANSIIPVLQAKVTIGAGAQGSGGSVIYTETKNISNLLPGASVDLNSVWNTGLMMPGDYRTTVEVSFENGATVTKTAAFKINSMLVLSGSIALTPSVVSLGNTAQVAYTLTNTGNADALAQIARISIIDPETQTVIHTQDITLDIPKNTSKSGQISTNTSGYSLKSYTVVLQTANQGTIKNIASTQFAVKDLTPPSVTIITPLANSIFSAAVGLSVLATDNASGIDKVEYQLDNGLWSLLAIIDPTRGRFGTSWEPLPSDGGAHTLSFRATDKAGNTSGVISVTFIVQMDSVAPETTITIGTPKYEANGKMFVAGSTTFILTATDNSSGVAKTEYRINNGDINTSVGQFNLEVYSDGTHTISYRSTDNATNIEKEKELAIILDKTPPVTTIFATDPVSPGGVSTISPNTKFSLTAVDTLSGVQAIMYRIDSGEWQPFMEAFSLAGLPVGPHTIAYKAKDNVLNEETAKTISLRLIAIDVTKKIDATPIVLVGIGKECEHEHHAGHHDNDRHDDKDNDDHKSGIFCDDGSDHHNHGKHRCREIITKITTMLTTAGFTFTIAKNDDEFTSLFRSGKFNTYVLVDFKEEQLSQEIREAIYSGDGLIFIKTNPETDPALDDLFGVKFRGKTTKRGLTVQLLDSPISNEGTMEAPGKAVISIITATTAQSFATFEDKHHTHHCHENKHSEHKHGDDQHHVDTYPAIIFNLYNKGRVLLYMFDLLSSPETAQATALFISSLNHVRPLETRVQAMGNVPISIRLNNSSEPVEIKLVETFPDTATVGIVTPEGTLKDNAITWFKSLASNEKSTFGYTLNLPDTAGSYKPDSALWYKSNGDYRLYAQYSLAVTIEKDSTSLAHDILMELNNITTDHKHQAKHIVRAIDSVLSVDSKTTSAKRSKRNIELIVEAIEELRQISIDISLIRLKLDELLRIWERKWFLAEEKWHKK